MEDKKASSSGTGLLVVALGVGLAIALIVGWIVFPALLFSTEKQPINFPHSAHEGLECDSCHYFHEDGSYSGAPGLSSCRECHAREQSVEFPHAVHEGSGCSECHGKESSLSPQDCRECHSQAQPVKFSHELHQDYTCEDCHSEGSSPGVDNCMECHEEMMTESEQERILVEDYIQEEKEIPWRVYAPKLLTEKYLGEDKEISWTVYAEDLLKEESLKLGERPWMIYAYQPDNVYFSHAAHKGEGMECIECHRDVSGEYDLPPVRQNRLTGYSKGTMKMVECEKCHAEQGASNACHVCHK